jgi:hypothetical protein
MEIPAYLNYCPPGGPFFDVPARDKGRFARSDAAAPEGWARAGDPDWVTFLPPEPLPAQGWKVHVSATVDNCIDVLEICWDYCTARGIAFKFLKSSEVLFLRSSKYGDRTASGKFVTIYPRDEDVLQPLLVELDARLDGFTGPSILSDLRWRSGPLYLRYGGFTRQEIRTEIGEHVLALRGPDGTLVPDERRPGFSVPDWVVVPAFLEEAMQARLRGRLTDFPYRPKQALHFSNGGGVYRGVDANGSAVLLKEARPLAGVDGMSEDAVARLERERWALEQLAGLPQIPRLIDYRRGHEHFFLVREEVDGVPLHQRAAERNPLLRAGATPQDFRDYTQWVVATLDAIEQGVAAMHARGVTYRDLHPGNILVRPDDTLAFIDFEAARPIEEDVGQAFGAPGYMAPADFRGADVDRYALGVAGVDLFVPLGQLARWGRHKIGEVLDLVERDFPVPADYAERVRGYLTPPARPAVPTNTAADEPPAPTVAVESVPPHRWAPHEAVPSPDTATRWEALGRGLTAGILASATPARPDRLYPGDPAQFGHPTGGLGFLYGAAGVLWALRTSDVDVPDQHVAWLRRAVDAATWDRPGFADGLSGVALTLDALGETDRAHDLMRQAIRLGEQPLPGRLADGLAGVGLTALALAGRSGDEALVRAADALVPRISSWTPDPRDRRWGPGLFGGPSGPGLFFVRLYEATGEVGLLARAETALRGELSGWGWDPAEPTLPDGLARSPYLGGGGGTALVLRALLAHRAAPDLAGGYELLREACLVPFTPEAGLLHGRAGVMTVVAGLDGPRSIVERHAEDLRVHSVLVQGQPIPTGRYSLRASCDVATGSAGVLLALGSLRGRPRSPFLFPADGVAGASASASASDSDDSDSARTEQRSRIA